MKLSHSKLQTPIYLKTKPDLPWPTEENVFYLLTADGLFLCRNHPFFRSSVPVDEWPEELAGHQPFLRLSYPKIPQRLFERVIGFFSGIGADYGAEAAALLVWDKHARAVQVVVPEQTSLVGTTWSGRSFPMEVYYDVPQLAAHQMLIGDIHSHVEMPAYASAMDQDDEAHRPGLHVVVGRLSSEPPDLHLEATVDGKRFQIRDPAMVLAGYTRRRPEEVPEEWLSKVTVKHYDYNKSNDNAQSPADNGQVKLSHFKPDSSGESSAPRPDGSPQDVRDSFKPGEPRDRQPKLDEPIPPNLSRGA
jgi:PRTRC genetic system protein A